MHGRDRDQPTMPPIRVDDADDDAMLESIDDKRRRKRQPLNALGRRRLSLGNAGRYWYTRQTIMFACLMLVPLVGIIVTGICR